MHDIKGLCMQVIGTFSSSIVAPAGYQVFEDHLRELSQFICESCICYFYIQ